MIALAVLAHQHRDEVGAARARRASPIASTRWKGRSISSGTADSVEVDVVGDVGRAGELARPLVGGEPRELEDEAVAGGQRRDRVVGLPVPGLDLGAGGGDVDVEGQASGWPAARSRRSGPGRSPSSVISPRRRRVSSASCSEASASAYAVSSTLRGTGRGGPRAHRRAAGPAASTRSKGSGASPARLGDEPQLGQRDGQPTGQPVEEARRRGAAAWSGRWSPCQSPGSSTVSQSL